MAKKKEIIAFYIIALLFVLTNAYAIFAHETLLFNVVPIFVVLMFALFFALDKLLLFSVFLVPLSVKLEDFVPNISFNIDLPTEPIFAAILLLFVLKQLHSRNIDAKIIMHPVSIAIYLYLGWRLISVITSTMPFVSLKQWVASLWFIVPFFFMLTQMFKDKKNINKFFWLYIISFSCIITYTIIKHIPYDFSQRSANYIMSPFYSDHTSYGAVLAMFIPILIGFVINKELKNRLRIISGIVLFYFIVGFILSYTRAAWVSAFAAVGVLIVLKFKINHKLVMSLAIVIASLFFIFQESIFFNLERNKQSSSTDFGEHVKSISNVSTDASNLERINRWNCAIRMFKEKPFFGWGPGTYQFNYAPYQYSYERTVISTNAGTLGNAHSEYLSVLCDSGILGLISFVLIMVYTFTTTVKNYYKTNSKSIKIMLASTMCGLATYYLHGFLNNFLDTDKLAIPYWGFIAVIVAIDIYIVREEKAKN